MRSKFRNQMAPCFCNWSMIFSRCAVKYSTSFPAFRASPSSVASTIRGAVSLTSGKFVMSMLSDCQIVGGQSGKTSERFAFSTGRSMVATRKLDRPDRRERRNRKAAAMGNTLAAAAKPHPNAPGPARPASAAVGTATAMWERPEPPRSEWLGAPAGVTKAFFANKVSDAAARVPQLAAARREARWGVLAPTLLIAIKGDVQNGDEDYPRCPGP
mmetsp:Transcript_101641/g.217643  ORF Transcript_101641/g.217643 Transcript_101641/m.217643 type:complete len:214 (-) Transcript_101641:2-643(-)